MLVLAGKSCKLEQQIHATVPMLNTEQLCHSVSMGSHTMKGLRV